MADYVPARLNGKMNPDWYRAYYLKNHSKIRQQQNARHLPSKMNRADYKRMLLSMLRVRDENLCGICRQVVDQGDEGVDHVLQRCLGGEDSADNIRLTHRCCNSWRPKRG